MTLVKANMKSPTKSLLNVLFENFARMKYEKAGALPAIHNEAEIQEAIDLFQSPKEKAMYNKWLDMDYTVSMAIINLDGLRFEVLRNYSNLRGYFLMMNALIEGEQLVNKALGEIKDIDERIQAAANVSKSPMVFTTIKATGDHLQLDIDFARVLGKKKNETVPIVALVFNVKKEAIHSATKFISWRAAILDTMNGAGFNIKTYRSKIDEYYESVSNPQLTVVESKNKSHDGFFSFDFSKLAIDEQMYNEYKENFLITGFK